MNTKENSFKYWLARTLLSIVPVIGLIYLIIKAIRGENRQLARAALVTNIVVWGAILTLIFTGLAGKAIRIVEETLHINNASVVQEKQESGNSEDEKQEVQRKYSAEQSINFSGAGVKIEFTAAEPVALTDYTTEKATFFTKGLKGTVIVNITKGQNTTYTKDIIEKNGLKLLKTIEDANTGYKGYYYYNNETNQYYVDVCDGTNEIMITSSIKINALAITNE